MQGLLADCLGMSLQGSRSNSQNSTASLASEPFKSHVSNNGFKNPAVQRQAEGRDYEITTYHDLRGGTQYRMPDTIHGCPRLDREFLLCSTLEHSLCLTTHNCMPDGFTPLPAPDFPAERG